MISRFTSILAVIKQPIKSNTKYDYKRYHNSVHFYLLKILDFRRFIVYNTNQKVFGSVLWFSPFRPCSPVQWSRSNDLRALSFFYTPRNYLRGVFFCLYLAFPPVTGTFSRGNVSNIFPIRFLSNSTGSNSSLSFCNAERFPTNTFG